MDGVSCSGFPTFLLLTELLNFVVEPSQIKTLFQLHLMRQIGYHVVQTYIPRYKTIICYCQGRAMDMLLAPLTLFQHGVRGAGLAVAVCAGRVRARQGRHGDDHPPHPHRHVLRCQVSCDWSAGHNTHL